LELLKVNLHKKSSSLDNLQTTRHTTVIRIPVQRSKISHLYPILKAQTIVTKVDKIKNKLVISNKLEKHKKIKILLLNMIFTIKYKATMSQVKIKIKV
jgi:hypothetical protein